MTDEPTLRLDEGRRLLDAGDFGGAVTVLAPLTGHPVLLPLSVITAHHWRRLRRLDSNSYP